MSLIENPLFKQRACPEGKYEIVRDDQDFRVCERCGLSSQTLVDDIGHDLQSS